MSVSRGGASTYLRYARRLRACGGETRREACVCRDGAGLRRAKGSRARAANAAGLARGMARAARARRRARRGKGPSKGTLRQGLVEGHAAAWLTATCHAARAHGAWLSGWHLCLSPRVGVARPRPVGSRVALCARDVCNAVETRPTPHDACRGSGRRARPTGRPRCANRDLMNPAGAWWCGQRRQRATPAYGRIQERPAASRFTCPHELYTSTV